MIPRKRHLLYIGRCFLCVGVICVGVVLAIGYKVAFVVYEAGIPLRQVNTVEINAQRRTSGAMHFWVTRHLEWHDAQRGNRSARRVVFVAPARGTGEGVKALVWAYAVAVVTRRVLHVHWALPGVLSARAHRRFVAAAGATRPRRAGALALLAGDTPHIALAAADLTNATHTVAVLSALRWPRETLPPYEWAVRRAAVRAVLDPSQPLRDLVRRTKTELRLCGYDERCARHWWHPNRVRYFAVHASLPASSQNLMRVAFCFSVALRRYAGHDAPVVYVSRDSGRWREVFAEVMGKAMPRARVVWGAWDGVDAVLAAHAEQILIGDATRVVANRAHTPEAGFLRGSGRYYSVVGARACDVRDRVNFDSDRTPPFW